MRTGPGRHRSEVAAHGQRQSARCLRKQVKDGEVWVNNFHISPYGKASRFNHDPMRPKKLLLHRREINRLQVLQREKGYALIP